MEHKCKDCPETYWIHTITIVGVGNKEHIEIDCPYCGKRQREYNTSDFVSVRRLDDK